MVTRRRGFALGMAIIVLAVVFTLGAAYSARTVYQLSNTARTVSSIQSAYLCRAGVRIALARQDGVRQFSETFDTGVVTVTVTDIPNSGPGSPILVVSVARCGRVTRQLEVRVEDGRILDWREVVL